MDWISETPTVPGFYWLETVFKGEEPVQEVVKVEQSGRKLVVHSHLSGRFWLDSDYLDDFDECRWKGPLKP